MEAPHEQVALITGASRGIGLAIARALGQRGYRIAFNDVSERETIDCAVHDLVSQGIEAVGYTASVTDLPVLSKMVDELTDRWGGIDVLVNNAGITRDGLFVRLPEIRWNEVLTVCLLGTVHCSRAVLKGMLKRRYGRIVNISSVVGFTGNAGQTSYATAKAAIIGFTRSLAREVAGRNVTVNAVAPGFIDTDMTKALPEEVKESWLSQVPLKRWGTPEDVAEVVAFLVSPSAGYITGQTIHVNGGLYMG
ncbi:MAG TPA: 3-oxoacyl-[acyl-carrier-protein] reductase [Atribacteraceae bacterium]|nr:3-oxoacyl-[acyl-carrier-protein] reductase [Atribacteraceae bacterium]